MTVRDSWQPWNPCGTDNVRNRLNINPIQQGGILTYHGIGQPPLDPVLHVAPERLRQQLTYLASNYEVLSLVTFYDRLRAGRSLRGCVALTFDDAYVNVVRIAGPLCAQLDIPATVFVSTAQAETGSVFWWDVVDDVQRNPGDGRWPVLLASLGMPPAPVSPEALVEIRSRMFHMRKGRGDRLIAAFGRQDPTSEWRSSTLEELDELARNERIDFGSHTMTHPVLPLLSHADQVAEIAGGYEMLRERLPRVRPFVAYPYGQYDHTTLAAAAEAGMNAGFSVQPYTPSHGDSPYAVPRFCASESTTPGTLLKRLNRAYRFLKIVRGERHPQLPRLATSVIE